MVIIIFCDWSFRQALLAWLYAYCCAPACNTEFYFRKLMSLSQITQTHVTRAYFSLVQNVVELYVVPGLSQLVRPWHWILFLAHYMSDSGFLFRMLAGLCLLVQGAIYCHRLGFEESSILFGEDLYKVLIKTIQYQCGKRILLLHASAITITITITMTTSKEQLKQKAEAESKRQRRKRKKQKSRWKQ